MSPRQQITFQGGRLPSEPARPHLRLAPLLNQRTLEPPPISADWLTQVPANIWGMQGNDQLGDCTCAGVAHKRIGDAWANQGVALPITTAQTEAFYQNFGYVPGDPSTDRGANCQDVLETWQKIGFVGDRLSAFARVDIANKRELQTAIALFGQIYTGFNVPQSAEDQFNAGQPWTVVKRSPLIGGHCVTIGAYDDAEGLSVVTWGAVQRMTWQFFTKYFDEAWVLMNPADFVDPATGDDRAGLSSAALQSDFSDLTGRSL